MPADALQGRAERANDVGAVGVRMGEKAGAGRGREGRRDQQLRVVGNAAALRGLGPAVIEDELPLAVTLHVERARADQTVAVAQHEVLRQPAGRGRDAAGLFEGREPAPLEKGRAITDQRIPCLRVDR